MSNLFYGDIMWRLILLMIQGPAERGKVNLQTSVYIQLKHIWCEYITFTFPPNKIIPFPSLQLNCLHCCCSSGLKCCCSVDFGPLCDNQCLICDQPRHNIGIMSLYRLAIIAIITQFEFKTSLPSFIVSDLTLTSPELHSITPEHL